MEEVTIIGIDLAKHSFQVHGAKADGSVAFRRKLSRGRLLSFLASQPGCTVAMEACASAHYWGREIAALGHEVRLVPPIYVKPFVKRSKNDAADAEATLRTRRRSRKRRSGRPCASWRSKDRGAAGAGDALSHPRPTGAPAHADDQRASGPPRRVRRCRSPVVRARIGQLAAVLEDGDCGLPEAVAELGCLLLGRIDELDEQIDGLDRELRTSARECEETARLSRRCTSTGWTGRSEAKPTHNRKLSPGTGRAKGPWFWPRPASWCSASHIFQGDSWGVMRLGTTHRSAERGRKTERRPEIRAPSA